LPFLPSTNELEYSGCNDIPLPLAGSITGHGRGQSDFAVYGTVGYSLEQKLEVIRKVLI